MKSFHIQPTKLFLTFSVNFLLFFSYSASYGSSNLALNQPITASSSENSLLTPEFAVDKDMSSRWSSDFSDNNWIAVDLGDHFQITGVKFHWQNSYAKDYHVQTSIDGINWLTIHTAIDNPGGIDEVTLEGAGRYLRMQGLRRATRYGYSMFNFEVYGAPLSNENIALNKPGMASSIENRNLTANKAVDGDSTSRWSSEFTDHNWIAVDLEAVYQITGARLNWQNSYSKDYEIQFSLDGKHWKTFHSVFDSDGGIDEMALNGQGRYFRVKGSDRATIYGHSMWELKVFGYEVSTDKPASKYPRPSAISESEKSPAVGNSGAPGKPINLRSRKIGLNKVTLDWAASDASKVTRYVLLRDGIDLVELKAPIQTYTDTGLRPATSYSYSLRAGDAGGNWSERSAILTTSTAFPGTSQGRRVTLNWTSPKARENGNYLELREIGGYEIHYKHRANSEYQVLILEDATLTEHSFSHSLAGYEFKIAVYDTNGLYSEFVPIRPRRP